MEALICLSVCRGAIHLGMLHDQESGTAKPEGGLEVAGEPKKAQTVENQGTKNTLNPRHY